MQCSVFIATSLDGFIARPDGSIDWLEAANQAVPPGEDCGYAAFMASVDLLVMGRETYQKVRTFPEWPYSGKPVWVASRRLPTGHTKRSATGVGDSLPAGVSITSQTPRAIVEAARREGHRRLYVDGGRLIQSFLAEGLITDLTITAAPVLLGVGRPLFGPQPTPGTLRLIGSRAFPFGFVQTTYRVEPERALA